MVVCNVYSKCNVYVNLLNFCRSSKFLSAAQKPHHGDQYIRDTTPNPVLNNWL